MSGSSGIGARGPASPHSDRELDRVTREPHPFERIDGLDSSQGFALAAVVKTDSTDAATQAEERTVTFLSIPRKRGLSPFLWFCGMARIVCLRRSNTGGFSVMADQHPTHTSEEESRQVAEEARQKEWAGHMFIRELFLGNFALPLIDPFPTRETPRPEFQQFYDALENFLKTEVDSALIDQTGEYPPHVVDGLRKLGAFGIKIPKEYGGLGFTVSEYCRAMELVGSFDANISALLSAHQSIGVPQPLKLFGTEEQKKKYLTRCAKGAISAFALTEPHVGSDPASLTTTAVPHGDGFLLNGEKLWCTNGTLAELLVVMARNPETKRISTFVVDTSLPGVKVEHRCRFMGLKALANGVISFKDVFVPRADLIGDEGAGLKIALITLNTGRLTLPAATAGVAKQCLDIMKHWSNVRVQWGIPVGKHEAISHKIAETAATVFAMDSVAVLASAMADRGGYDIRLEAAAAKEWNTVRCWEIIDRTLQVRGGRGYETETSLTERGEIGIPVERMLRDSRVNLIFEGSSEVMHLFMAREAVDKHLSVAGAMIDPKATVATKAKALPAILAFYGTWYPPLWLRGIKNVAAYQDWGRLATHLRFIDRASRKLARESFHGMAIYQAKMERKQGFLFRLVDVVMELFVMSATVSRAKRMQADRHPDAAQATELADLFCRQARRRVKKTFSSLWSNDDARMNAVSAGVLSGAHDWLRDGAIDLGWTAEMFKTKSITGYTPVAAPTNEKKAAAS
jgi:alkylation response protein AidB-like acyl-CoA dehydrogenase